MRAFRLSSSVFSLCVLAAAATVLAQVKPPEGFPAEGAPPVVTLQSAGAAPRRALRYQLAKGPEEPLSMDLKMSMGMDMAGGSMPPIDIPVLRMLARLAITDVTPAGEASYAMAFTSMAPVDDPAADQSLLASIRAALPDISSVKGTATVNNRGLTRDAHFSAGQAQSPQLTQILQSMEATANSLSLPLPEEPVGVGAAWDVRQSVTSGGLHIFQTIHVEVTSIDAAGCTFKTSLVQTAPPQPVDNPALPPGTQASLTSYDGHGTGTVAIKFHSLVPTSEVNLATTSAMSIALGGDAQQLTVKMTAKSSVAPVK